MFLVGRCFLSFVVVCMLMVLLIGIRCVVLSLISRCYLCIVGVVCFCWNCDVECCRFVVVLVLDLGVVDRCWY